MRNFACRIRSQAIEKDQPIRKIFKNAKEMTDKIS